MSRTWMVAVAWLLAAIAGNAQSSRDWSTYPDFDALRVSEGSRDGFVGECTTTRPAHLVEQAADEGRWSDALALGLEYLENARQIFASGSTSFSHWSGSCVRARHAYTQSGSTA